MDLNKELKQIRIDILTGTVFIQNKNLNFSYTPAKKSASVENYFGGLQSNYDCDSNEYQELQYELCRIAWNVLNIVKDRSVNNFVAMEYRP